MRVPQGIVSYDFACSLEQNPFVRLIRKWVTAGEIDLTQISFDSFMAASDFIKLTGQKERFLPQATLNIPYIQPIPNKDSIDITYTCYILNIDLPIVKWHIEQEVLHNITSLADEIK